MRRTRGVTGVVGTVGIALCLVCGCTTTERHTGAGAMTGAMIGGLLAGPDHVGKGMMMGAMAGGAIGHAVGEKEEAKEIQANTHTVWVANPNGSHTRVDLRRTEGGAWIGPRGEYYQTLPTEEQLRPVYGLR